MAEKIHLEIPGADNQQIHAHLFLPEMEIDVPVFIFCHGFKGFRDWGFFPRIADCFCPENVAVLTFNHTFNGVDEAHPTDFNRLDLFAQNTVTRELSEIHSVINWVHSQAETFGFDPDKIILGGHSRGGANAIVAASTSKFISKVFAWAPVAHYASMFASADLKKWEKEGVLMIPNVRTAQQMPLNYAYWQDLIVNAEKYNVMEAAGSLQIPLLLIHGQNDKSVPVVHSEKLYDECWHAFLVKMENADHTFNTPHPAPAALCDQTVELLNNTLEFILD
ncbi:MAG: alpha/beta fold hydrolase [Sphingomonadales bacterium]|nr:alpha/beta fold hydrolase [Sphingomonadales bacterium]